VATRGVEAVPVIKKRLRKAKAIRRVSRVRAEVSESIEDIQKFLVNSLFGLNELRLTDKQMERVLSQQWQNSRTLHSTM
jgi:hypothetical protein